MEVGPVKQKVSEIRFKQSKSDILPKLPMRAMFLGNSGNGKTSLIVNLITDERFYGNKAFSKVLWFSPTSLLDDTLTPVREYVEKNLEQDPDLEPVFLSDVRR